MKKCLFAVATLALLFACTPEKTPGGDNVNDNSNSGDSSQPSVVELTGIALTEHEITIEKGGNTVLYVKFTPENATNKNVTWVSSNTSIATVVDGIVVGVAQGSTEIIAKSGNFTDKCQVTVVISATSVSLDQTELALALGETATLTATVLPEDSTDKVQWSSSDEAVATVKDGEVTAVALGEATITAKAGDKTATCEVVVVKTHVPAGAVDLGLSVYWATCNLGAAKPEDYGDYYAWGETDPKEDYFWPTYKWCNGSSSTLTKYNTSSSYGTVVDNKTVLDPEDDVAHVKLAGNWRMPTIDEWTELREQCTWEWTSNYKGTGIAGLIVTSNKTGYTDKSVFLPVTGHRDGTILSDAGFYGHYWSSSLREDNPSYALYVGFGSDRVYAYFSYRCFGQSVRPVSE